MNLILFKVSWPHLGTKRWKKCVKCETTLVFAGLISADFMLSWSLVLPAAGRRWICHKHIFPPMQTPIECGPHVYGHVHREQRAPDRQCSQDMICKISHCLFSTFDISNKTYKVFSLFSLLLHVIPDVISAPHQWPSNPYNVKRWSLATSNGWRRNQTMNHLRTLGNMKIPILCTCTETQ